jgi:putative phosphoesterase
LTQTASPGRRRGGHVLIGILSDSHDNIYKVRRAAELFRSLGCSLVIHAGDFIAPFAAKELEAAGCPIKAVFGNCDGERDGLKTFIGTFGEIADPPLVFDWEKKRFLLTHREVRVEKDLASQAYDVVIFGHTHNPVIRIEGKTILINPGEAGGWMSGKCTAALLDPVSGSAEIVSLG